MAMPSFARSVATLSSGQAIATALPILAAPLLGRLYSPAEYGFLALYMSVASILAIVVTLQYQMAIISEASDHRARAIVYLCVVLSGVFCAPIGLGSLISWMTWLDTDGYREGRNWVFLLPVSILMTGLVAGASTLANRHKRYDSLAKIQVASVCGSVSASILFGFLGWGVHGLFLGYVTSQIIQVIGQVRVWIDLAGSPHWPRRKTLLGLARRHRDFLKFSLPGSFISNVNLQLPVFLLGALGAGDTLGQFSRARQLVSLPITLLGGAISSVYRQEAAEQYRTKGSCRSLLLKTSGALLAIGLLPCLGFIYIAPHLFALYLGEQWRTAGEIAQLIAPMLLLRLVTSPISPTLYVTGYQRLDFSLSLVALTLTTGALGLSAVIGKHPIDMIIAYTIAMSVIYTLYFIACICISER